MSNRRDELLKEREALAKNPGKPIEQLRKALAEALKEPGALTSIDPARLERDAARRAHLDVQVFEQPPPEEIKLNLRVVAEEPATAPVLLPGRGMRTEYRGEHVTLTPRDAGFHTEPEEMEELLIRLRAQGDHQRHLQTGGNRAGRTTRSRFQTHHPIAVIRVSMLQSRPGSFWSEWVCFTSDGRSFLMQRPAGQTPDTMAAMAQALLASDGGSLAYNSPSVTEALARGLSDEPGTSWFPGQVT